ncbi:MAG: carbohydrate kinase family protein [Cyanobacteriota bacterium]
MNENKKFDIVSIGGATQDVFVKSDLSKILKFRDLFTEIEFLCFSYGSKLNIDEVLFDVGGGAVNTSINFANLDLKSAALVKIGNDSSADLILKTLAKHNVSPELIKTVTDCKTGFSIILNSFEGDRTVLAFRGANSRLTGNDIDWQAINQAKWIYVSSLTGDSNDILDTLSDYAEEHGVNMAFNPGSTQIKRGTAGLKRILSQTEFLILNKEEASQLTAIKETFRYIDPQKCTGCGTCVDLCPAEIFQIDNNKAIHVGKRESCIKGCEICVTHCPERAISVSPWASNIDEQLVKLKSYGPKIVVITDGKKGVQVYDGEYRYLMPSYQVPVKSTLGAGDCFASTFTASMIKTNWNIEKSVMYAAANAANLVQEFGGQSGLKTFNELDKFIANQDPELFRVNKQHLECYLNISNT